MSDVNEPSDVGQQLPPENQEGVQGDQAPISDQQPGDVPQEKKAKKEKESKDSKIAKNDIVKVRNKAMAGKSTFHTSEEPVVFDDDGIAKVPEWVAETLVTVPGYERA